MKLHSSKRCSSYLDTDHQTNTNAKRRRFFPPWCLRCCSSRCWAKCQIRRRGTRPGGAQGSARARPSQAPREILVSSSSSSSSGLGPDFLYIGPRRQDAVLYVSATMVRWTAPRGACNRQALHVIRVTPRTSPRRTEERSVRVPSSSSRARWSTSKRKKTEAQGAVLNLDGPHSHRSIGEKGRGFSSTFWTFTSTTLMW